MSKLIDSVPGRKCKYSAMHPTLIAEFEKTMNVKYVEDHLTTIDAYNKYAYNKKKTADYCMFQGVIGYNYIVVPFLSDKKEYIQLVIFHKIKEGKK